MNLFSRIFTSRDKAKESPKNRLSSSVNFLFGSTSSGKSVNAFSAMQSSAVYACVRILSESIAALPLHLYKYKEDGSKEIARDNPLDRILHDEPNPEMSSFLLRETLMSHLLLYGNAYAQIIHDGRGHVKALYPLLPNLMTVDRGSDGKIYYIYQRSCDGRYASGTVVLRKEQVLHIPALGFDGLIGYSPIAMAKNAIGIALSTEDYAARFFANGANPGGILEHPGVVKDPDKLRESWHLQFSGVNSHKIAVLEEGLQFKQISIPPEQSQFLQTRKFQINEIARIFRIPPHMVGDLEKSSFSNIEQQSLEFVKYSLDPWVIRWEQAMQQSLLLPSEKAKYSIRFNVDGLLRGDYASRMSGYATARQNGWMSANDIRELENMNRIPSEEGGDLYLINGSFTKLSNPGQFSEQAASKAAASDEESKNS